MPNPHPPQPLLKQFTNYTNSGVGLENFLRLIQSICQVISASAVSTAEAEPWRKAFTNLALSRRYFRYFQFIDCFERVGAILSGQDAVAANGYVLRTLAVGEWSCLGGYILLEAFTILDALNIYPSPLAEQVLLESYKFWFYSMVFAIVGIIWQLFVPVYSPKSQQTKSNNVKQDDEKKGSERETEKTSEEANATAAAAAAGNTNTNTARLLSELIALGCDILIPVQSLGWLDVDDLTIGSAAVVSTLLMGKYKWAKVQEQGGAL